jgi:hypothetical protein
MDYAPATIALPKTRLTVDEYLAWAEDQPGRYELLNGTVHAMAPERAIHAKIQVGTSHGVGSRDSGAQLALSRPAGRNGGAHR